MTFSMSSGSSLYRGMSVKTGFEDKSKTSGAGADLLGIIPTLFAPPTLSFFDELLGPFGMAEISLLSTSGCGTSSGKIDLTAMSEDSVVSSRCSFFESPIFLVVLGRVFGTSS